MNLLIISGRLGADAEVRYTQSGTAVASWSMAVDSGFGDKKKTNWFKCALFGKRAEGGLIQYLTKGAQITVTGEVSLNTWEAKGKTGASLDVVVNQVELGPKDSRPANNNTAENPPKQADAVGGGDFDEIPF